MDFTLMITRQQLELLHSYSQIEAHPESSSHLDQLKQSLAVFRELYQKFHKSTKYTNSDIFWGLLKRLMLVCLRSLRTFTC